MPQGFRTFQILLAVGFLLGFLCVLGVFVWKISEINLDLNRVSVATQVRTQIQSLLVDGRACELNFAGLKLGDVPVSIGKLVDLRSEVILRSNKSVEDPEIELETLRLHLLKIDSIAEPPSAELGLEMVFSDSVSGRQSPLRVPLEAQGLVLQDNQFQVKTCRAEINGSAD
jgi:hypothetical protein